MGPKKDPKQSPHCWHVGVELGALSAQGKGIWMGHCQHPPQLSPEQPSRLGPEGHLACFRMAHELSMAFTFLSG